MIIIIEIVSWFKANIEPIWITIYIKFLKYFKRRHLLIYSTKQYMPSWQLTRFMQLRIRNIKTNLVLVRY